MESKKKNLKPTIYRPSNVLSSVSARIQPENSTRYGD